MTRLDRYKEKLKELEWKRNESMRRGKYVQMRRLEEDLKQVRAEIAECERYEPKPIRELMTSEQIDQSNLIALMIEAHLAADFLTDCCYNIQDTIEGMGFHAVTVIPELKELLKMADKFASKLAGRNDAFDDLLVSDETLIAALHKKTLGYIQQKLTHGTRKRDSKGRFSKVGQ